MTCKEVPAQTLGRFQSTSDADLPGIIAGLSAAEEDKLVACVPCSGLFHF